MKRDTVLCRADPLTIATNREGTIDVLRGGRWERCPPATLTILDAFAQPRSVSAVIESLVARAAGKQHWIDLTRTILVLRRKGLLVAPGGVAAVAPGADGFATAAAHISLLNDRPRTTAMIDAIRAVVRQGDVVVEIGTGCGVLAVAAARAGAAHVYAIEATAAASVARTVCNANGVGDRVTIVGGWSPEVTLPAKANVLVAEIAGNEPFGAQLLEVVLDARARLLTPEAAIVPRTLRMFAQPVRIPDRDLAGVAFTTANTGHWREWYGFDFSALSTEDLLPAMMHVPAEVAARWERLGEPLLLSEIDLRAVEQPALELTRDAVAPSTLAVNAVLAYTELDLAPGLTRIASPYAAERGARWTIPVWLRPDPLAVAAGDRYRLSLSYPGNTGRTMIAIEHA